MIVREGLAAVGSVARAASDKTNRAAEALVVVIGSGMALIIAVQVFSRYVLNHSLFWSEELGRMCLVWITFLAGSAAYKRHGHVGVDFFVKRMPPSGQKAAAVLVLLLSLSFFSLLLVQGASFAWFVSAQRTTALGIPLTVPYAVIPLSALLFLLHGISHLLDVLSTGTWDK